MSDNSSLDGYLAKLPDDERRAILLRYQVGHSIPEIAEIMQLPEAETKTLLSTARRRLSAYIDAGSG